MSRQEMSTESSKDLIALIIMALNDGSEEAQQTAFDAKEEIYMRKNQNDIKYVDWLYQVI